SHRLAGERRFGPGGVRTAHEGRLPTSPLKARFHLGEREHRLPDEESTRGRRRAPACELTPVARRLRSGVYRQHPASRLVASADNSAMSRRTGQLAAPLIVAILLVGFSLAPTARATRAGRAGAASLPFRVGLRVSASAEAGAVNLLTVAVSAPITTLCTLQISGTHFAKTLPSRRLGSVMWRWRAPMRAPKGVWTFTATCREGARWVRSWYSAEMGFPEHSGALLGAADG